MTGILVPLHVLAITFHSKPGQLSKVRQGCFLPLFTWVRYNHRKEVKKRENTAQSPTRLGRASGETAADGFHP
ncbi:MAG: hypothetical protein B1H40_02940 [Candidatus Latescibacteria bacterium 4484_181]|nr:MAG: hypothetical protein B1H40_02940 [Candidatus Latescibacteria bacterium 4484_181]RKY68013.1 MAG: hypothetical protein DRQ02_05590 [Candidatus Latescibacterota bacterium]RKY72704.1 MAG: hypothetical protein DRQ24_04485 [Candidatus Latescibacterota bacterium]